MLFPFDPERASFLDRLQRSIGERWYGSQMPGATLTYVWPRAVARDTIRHLVIFNGGGREIHGLETARQCPLFREATFARARAAKNEFSGDRNSPLLLR